MGIAVAVLIAFAFFASFRYKVTNKKLARIKYFNEVIENGGYDTLTQEEKLERIQLINQLAFKYDEEYDLSNVVYRNNVPEEEEFHGEGVAAAAGELAEDMSREEELESKEEMNKTSGGSSDNG